MVKRVFVFIVFLVALVSIGLVKCAGSMPYADSDLSTDSDLSADSRPAGLDPESAFSTSYLYHD